MFRGHNYSTEIFFIVFLFVYTLAFAQEDLQLSGVMQGNKPTAIVNDKIVAVGDSIGNYKVVEIAAGHVVFENKSGKITKYLKALEEKIVKQAAPKPQVAVQKSSDLPPVSREPQSNSQITAEARKHLDASMEYLREGDGLLKGNLKFERLYVKAADLCTDAEREAQAALSGISDAAVRSKVNDHIARTRKMKEAILRDRADFNTRVRSALAGKKLFAGMTGENVISGWGPPLLKRAIGSGEQWTYQDSNGYQKELTFDGGVLVAF